MNHCFGRLRCCYPRKRQRNKRVITLHPTITDGKNKLMYGVFFGCGFLVLFSFVVHFLFYASFVFRFRLVVVVVMFMFMTCMVMVVVVRVEQIHPKMTQPDKLAETRLNRTEPTFLVLFQFFIFISGFVGYFCSKPENRPKSSYSVRFSV